MLLNVSKPFVLFVIRNSLQLHKGRCSARASGVGALHLRPAGPARHVQSDEPVGSVSGEVLLRSDVGSSVAKVNANMCTENCNDILHPVQ